MKVTKLFSYFVLNSKGESAIEILMQVDSLIEVSIRYEALESFENQRHTIEVINTFLDKSSRNINFENTTDFDEFLTKIKESKAAEISSELIFVLSSLFFMCVSKKLKIEPEKLVAELTGSNVTYECTFFKEYKQKLLYKNSTVWDAVSGYDNSNKKEEIYEAKYFRLNNIKEENINLSLQQAHKVVICEPTCFETLTGFFTYIHSLEELNKSFIIEIIKNYPILAYVLCGTNALGFMLKRTALCSLPINELIRLQTFQ